MARYDTDKPAKRRSPFRHASSHGGTAARIATWAIFLAASAFFYFFRFHGANNLAGLLVPRANSQLLLWYGIATIAVRNWPGSAEAILTAIGCLSGGLVAALLFASMRCLMLLFLRETYHNAKARKVAAWAAGIAATLAFVSHQPNWIAVGWVRPELFEAAFAATVISLLVFAMAHGRFRYLAAFAFLYGLLIFECADMFRLAPLFAIYTVFLLARTGRANLNSFLALGGLFVLGAAIYLLLVDMEAGHPEMVEGEIQTFGTVAGQLINRAADALGIRRGQIVFHNAMSATSNFWIAIVTHYRLAFQVWIHQSTSLLLIIVAFAPWAVSIGLGAWTFGRTPRTSDIVLHILLVAATVVGLSRTSLSPWGMMGPLVKSGSAAGLPCFAYALMSATAGYLVGWGVVRAGGSLFCKAPTVVKPKEEDDDEEEFFLRLRVRAIFYFARLLAWALFIFVAATAVLNFKEEIRAGVIPDQKEDSLGIQMFKPRE